MLNNYTKIWNSKLQLCLSEEIVKEKVLFKKHLNLNNMVYSLKKLNGGADQNEKYVADLAL